jgi:hypothetical protein
MLPAIDRTDEDAVIAATVVSGLGMINTGLIAHSLRPTRSGLKAVGKVAKKKPLQPKPEGPSSGRKRLRRACSRPIHRPVHGAMMKRCKSTWLDRSAELRETQPERAGGWYVSLHS